MLFRRDVCDSDEASIPFNAGKEAVYVDCKCGNAGVIEVRSADKTISSSASKKSLIIYSRFPKSSKTGKENRRNRFGIVLASIGFVLQIRLLPDTTPGKEKE